MIASNDRRTIVKPLCFLVFLAALVLPQTASAAEPVHFVVLRENGMGSAAQAKPYVDELMKLFAKKNGWASAKGKYMTRRKRARRYIKKKKPQFGILSLGAYLSLHEKHSLSVLGTVDAARAGGRQYHLISRSAAGLNGCKGKALASNHLRDKRFINRVVLRGEAQLSDFEVTKTRRPVQTIKKVTSGKAVCALVDDAQLAELKHIDGTNGIKTVWSSKKLPPMPVVAFSSATAADRAKLRRTLSGLCSGQGRTTCDKVEIRSLKPASDGSFATVRKLYGR